MNINRFGIEMEKICNKFNDISNGAILYRNIICDRRTFDYVELTLTIKDIDDIDKTIKLSFEKENGIILNVSDDISNRDNIKKFFSENYISILNIEKEYREFQNELMDWLLRNTYLEKYEFNDKKYGRKIIKVEASPFIEGYNVGNGITFLRLKIDIDNKFVKNLEWIELLVDAQGNIKKCDNSIIIFDYEDWKNRFEFLIKEG